MNTYTFAFHVNITVDASDEDTVIEEAQEKVGFLDVSDFDMNLVDTDENLKEDLK